MAKKIEKDPIDLNFEKHMHDGHRSRLLKQVNEHGYQGLTYIQKLEFVLCYVFPRGDVNPLAHRLLARFEKFHYIFEAPVSEIMRVPGMGETSAMKLKALLSIYDEYNIDKYNNNSSVDDLNDFYALIELLLRHKNKESLYLFGVSPSGVIGNPRSYGRGNAQKVMIEATDVTNYVSTFQVNQLIVVHNHPNGSCELSVADEEAFIKLNNMLAILGIRLFDSFIVGRDGIYSWARDARVRHFSKSVVELTDTINNPQKMLPSR